MNYLLTLLGVGIGFVAGVVLTMLMITYPIFKQPGRCLVWSPDKSLHYSNILNDKNAGLRDVDGNLIKPGQTLLVTRDGGLLVIVNVGRNR